VTAELRQPKILIVDDEPGNVRLLERVLKMGGYLEMRSTTDPRQVIELCTTFEPDLVLLDLRMPGLSGFEVLRRLRDSRPDDALPTVLLLTGDDPTEVETPARAAGAVGVLRKPLHLPDLLRAVGAALGD
jgi:putative two-component system response regulator